MRRRRLSLFQLSLFPLDFKEAVAALLKVKPPPKEKLKEQEKQEQKKPSD